MRSLMPLAMVLVSVGAGCGPLNQGVDEEPGLEEARQELSAGVLSGQIVAYATTNASNTGKRQVFGPGTYYSFASGLDEVGDDAIRVLELAPAMRVRACQNNYATLATCASYENLTNNNKTFSVAGGISRLDVRSLVVAYRDGNQGGTAQGLEIGRHEAGRNHLRVVGNDTISSLRLAPGLTARLCSDNPETTVGGTCYAFNGSYNQLPAAIDNRTSWVEVRPVTVLHRDPDFAGVSQRLTPGVFGTAALSLVGNDTVSSVTLHEGVEARLYTDNPNTTVGWHRQELVDSTPRLAPELDNRTSWVELRDAVILSPLNEEIFTGGLVTLRAHATSPVDGPLTGAALAWRSQRDGYLGTGASLAVQLSADGCNTTEHRLTLKAVDSQGRWMETVRTVYVKVIC